MGVNPAGTSQPLTRRIAQGLSVLSGFGNFHGAWLGILSLSRLCVGHRKRHGLWNGHSLRRFSL